MSTMQFIEPRAPDLHIFSGFSLPRLGTILLATLAQAQGWRASTVIEEQHPLDWDELRAMDLVGISTITSTAPRAYAIADRVRAMGVPVVMGGPHVTFLPEEALEHADYVIRGEAEPSLEPFLKAFREHRGWEKVPGLSYRSGGRILHNDSCRGCVDLDALPFPDFSLVRGKTLSAGGKHILPVMTSRGCPYDCSFCSVTGMFGRRYRWRSVENVIAELRRYDSPGNYIFFYDDNFAARPLHTRDLLEAMIAERFRFRWSTQVRADLAREEEMLRLMRRAGCHTVFIGFESVNPDSLRAMNKRQSVEDVRNAARLFRRSHIHVHGMFVLGLDEDHPRTVRETVRFARRHRLTSAQFLILTPLPGTRCYEELKAEGRITFTDWSLYDAHHVVYQPKHFSLAALQRAQIRAHKKFYSLRESMKRLFRFSFLDIGVAHYARRLNRHWRQRNRLYLRLLDLLSPASGQTVTADIRLDVRLDYPGGRR